MVMMMFYEYGRTTMMYVSKFTHNGKSGKYGSTNLCAYVCVSTWYILHINLMEDMREQLHPMVVIDSHELVILLLIDLVAVGFAIDDSGHAIERIPSHPSAVLLVHYELAQP